jgi:outer membrane PBP1 activator LpoA protein
MIMDSGDFPDVGSAANSAARAGAELIIGPLTPEAVQDWRPNPQPSIPMLTLTWLPSQPPSTTPPVQLALTPEDEARQLARLAFDAGARSALVVRPEGDWGDRVSGALVDAWQQLEGELRALAVYSGQADYSSSLKAALQLAESEARASRVRRLLAEPVEFFPRRRSDLDVIFMLTEQSQQARSLKPLFAFHYAGDLPVYTTSHIFTGRRDPQRDRDLNGVRMLETPYLLEPSAALPALLREGGVDEELADMHALGADAFMLNWRLAQLRASPQARIRGQTGLLSMDASGRVHRELTPAMMREGLPTPD